MEKLNSLDLYASFNIVMKIRHIVVISLFVIVNALILMALFFRPSDEVADKEKENFIPHLDAATVLNVEENFEVSGYGTVSSFNTVDVSAEASGKMSAGKRSLKPGVKFKKGDLLFKIDDTELRYTLRSRKSTFINQLANLLPDIKVDYNSEFKKWSDYIESIKLNENLPTLPSWNSDKEKIFLSTRMILTDYFSIKSLEEQLKKYSIYAPFSGMITEVYMPDFSFVNPGAKIIRIAQTGNYEIPVSIPVSQLHLIEIGTKCKVYSTDGTEKGAGSVVRISEVINKSTQSVSVYVKPIAYDNERFIEGEYLMVKIDAQTSHTGMRIPLSAIHENQVLVYSSADSLLRPKQINVLNENENGAFVSGLKNSEIVILHEVLNYSDTTKYGVIIK